MAAPEEFKLLAGHSALDFANTLDDRYYENGAVERLTSFDRLVAFCRESKLIAPAESKRLVQHTSKREADKVLQAAIELREALYCLFRSIAANETPPAVTLKVLNRFLAEAAASRTIALKNGSYFWEPADTAEKPRALLWRIGEEAAALLLSEERRKIRECGDETCRWLFLDQSKNHSRRWCDMKICGNRSKARKFHERQKNRT